MGLESLRTHFLGEREEQRGTWGRTNDFLEGGGDRDLGNEMTFFLEDKWTLGRIDGRQDSDSL